MDFNDIYLMREAFTRGALRVRPVSAIESPFALTDGSCSVECPVIFCRDEGRHAYDVVGTTFAAVKLFSKRFFDALSANGVTGWRTFEAQIEGAGEQVRDSYTGLVVTGRCGRLQPHRSSTVIGLPAAPGGKPKQLYVGLFFDPDSWDGSDMFLPSGTALTFVTQRVKYVLEAAAVSNLSLTSAATHQRLWR